LKRISSGRSGNGPSFSKGSKDSSSCNMVNTLIVRNSFFFQRHKRQNSTKCSQKRARISALSRLPAWKDGVW
jgi:hypothetical protein